MTEEEILSLDERGLDVAIAKHIMRWTEPYKVRKRGSKEFVTAFKNRPGDTTLGDHSVYYTEDGTKVCCGEPFSVHIPPPWSSSKVAVWELVDKIPWPVGVHNSWGDWECSVYRWDGDEHICEKSAMDPSLPKAICKAILLAYFAVKK